METPISSGILTAEAVAFLKRTVVAGYNVLISGGINPGRMAFLDTLSALISKTERIITIEDSVELQFPHIGNLMRSETCSRSAEGGGQIRIVNLIRASLRMDPDYITVGEVCGTKALDMLQTMNTGHDGSLSIGRTNSAADMLTQLRTTVLGGTNPPFAVIQRQIASALDLIAYLGRFRDWSRRVFSIAETGGALHDEIASHGLSAFQEEKEQDGFRVRGGLCTVGTLRCHEGLDAVGLIL